MLIENAMDNKPKPLQHGRQGLRTFSALVCLLLMTTSLFAQEKTVTGTVTDSTNEPLIGASVVIQGTSNGTITDIDGKYSITASPDNVLEFSYVGNGEARCESRQPACDKYTAERGLTNAG